MLTLATGTAEREATLMLLDRRLTGPRVTLGPKKAHDVAPFINPLRDRAVTPHIAVNGYVSKAGHRRRTALDGGTTVTPAVPSASDPASGSSRFSAGSRARPA